MYILLYALIIARENKMHITVGVDDDDEERLLKQFQK
jgi:hypothetical protein